MDAATEFDIGPLTWVKNEVDLALERADLALQKYSESLPSGIAKDLPVTEATELGDLTQITFCRTHLHQVQGALTIVGLDGVTQFAEALELLLEAIAQRKRPANHANITLARRSLTAIRHYLDDLINGQPNQPLRLLPIYRDVQSARGLVRFSAADLFFPDLSIRPPRREKKGEGIAGMGAIKALDPAALKKLLHLERARFQRGLLAWLRTPKERSGVSEMLTAVRHIEATEEMASARAFWWVASGFLAALADGALPAEVGVKQLCARIDLQIRRLLEGSKKVTERLMRDTLYLVANADSRERAVQQVKDVYRLPSLMPSIKSEHATPPAPLESARRHLGEVIAAAEESWSKFCAGTAQALPAFRDHAAAICATVELLGHTDLRRLAQATAAAANWVAAQPARHSEVVGMEIATAIILIQNAQENFPLLGVDFAHQVDVMVARLHGCIAKIPPSPGSEIPALDEMSRRAQEKLLIAQVAKEIQYNLAQIEPVLDTFFRGEGQREDLEGLDAPLRQVIGALTMMRHEGAVAVLRQCSNDIKHFATPEYVALDEDFERVADRLSVVGFFVDSLAHGTNDFESFVRGMQPSAPHKDEPDEAFLATAEQEVEQQKREAHALLEAIKEQPENSGLREELKQNLATWQEDANLVADKELVQQTQEMLSALAAGGDTSRPIETAIAHLKSPTPQAPTPSEATLQLAQASAEEIDAELLGIFLEEAREVIAHVDSKLKLLVEQPHNNEALSHLRRSFHTLKGSGRMVGLRELGEVAWAVEQVLNLWLRQESDVGQPIFDLLTLAQSVFAAWIEHLEKQAPTPPDATRLLALADALRLGSDSLLEEEREVERGGKTETATRAPTSIVSAPASAPEKPLRTAEIIPFELPKAAVSPPAEITPERIETPEFVELADFELAPLDLPSFFEEETTEVRLSEESEPPAAMPPSELAAAPTAPLTDAPAVVALPAIPAEAVQPRISVSVTLNEIFLEEAGGHLTTLQHEFSALQTDPALATPPEMLRAAHTLGGIAGTLGLIPVNRLGRALEHALLRRDHATPASSPQALETIGQAIVELERMLAVIRARSPLEGAPHLVAALDSLYITPFDEQLAANEAPLPTKSARPDEAPRLLKPEPEAVPEMQMPEAPNLEDEFDEQLLPIFLEEAIDLNQKIAAKLRAWRANPSDGEVAHTLARLLHTLKGSARMAGAMNLGAITHAIETRVEEARRSGSAPPELIDEIDSTFDAICQIVDRLLRGESLDLPSEKSSAAQTLTPEVSQHSGPVAPASALPLPEEMAHESVTELAVLRVRADLIDRLVNDAGELSIARSRIEGEMRHFKDSLLDLTENIIRLRRQLREIEIQAESQMQSRAAHTTHAAPLDEQHPGFDPLEFDRFTRFQELTRMMAESVNDVGTVQQILLKNVDEANAAILAQSRLNRELQQELMSVRMVPFNSIADRLYRIVRQTAKELGKRANLDIKGGQLEMDRSVLDKMAAPIEHLLRNAIAHGLETPETRSALGKPEIGEIVLTLMQEGNQIVLNLSDDGAGLDFKRIRERATATGLLNARNVEDSATDSAADTTTLVDLIFAPGLSTADELSQIAGRGVGLDVVKTELASLGGRIEVSTTSGAGTAFRLYIPLTLALIQALLVRTGHKLYAIPSVMIAQLLDLKEAALKRAREANEIEWMNQRYPFSFLSHLLGDSEALPEIHRQYWVLLLRSGDQRLAVQIDEPKGNQEIVVKNIGPQLARVVGIDGATVLGNGQVILILNPIALTRRLPNIALAAPVKPELTPTPPPISIPTILVVDDSLTVRKFTTRLLVREGYQVITAKDGVEALEHLVDVVPDVMLVDIEMPRMDGFDLTRNIRADERLKHIPIIIITSRTADKHRHYAFEIGVDQYLGKPYREEELLQLVSSYVKPQRIVNDVS